jgi:hypothetical protein
MRRLINSIIFLGLLSFPVTTVVSAIELGSIQGKWKLAYRGNYGYQFQFYKNYRALCILYLGNETVIFKGVYTNENENLRINIYEMRRDSSPNSADYTRNFIKTSSSYFVFRAEYQKEKTDQYLILFPEKTFIDGISSEGYFEPTIKLKKVY